MAVPKLTKAKCSLAFNYLKKGYVLLQGDDFEPFHKVTIDKYKDSPSAGHLRWEGWVTETIGKHRALAIVLLTLSEEFVDDGGKKLGPEEVSVTVGGSGPVTEKTEIYSE